MKMFFMVIKNSLLGEIKAKYGHENLKFFLLLVFGFSLILLLVFFIMLRLNGEVMFKEKNNSSSEVNRGAVDNILDEIHEQTRINIEDWFYLDVEGAVNNPGIYVLPVIDGRKPRLFQLIDVAGGFHDRVNWQQARKIVNLAEEVSDGQQVYIPFDFELNEEFQNHGVDKSLGKTTAENVVVGFAEENKVSINSASIAELKSSLTGVGDARAQKLIDGRPWLSIEEAIEKKAITQKIADDNVNKISL